MVTSYLRGLNLLRRYALRGDIRPGYLAAIVESSDDAIIGQDLHGVIKSWNRGAEAMFGYRPEEVIGQSIRMLIPPDRRGEELPLLETVRSGEKVVRFESVRIRKDGTEMLISLALSPIWNRRGRIIGCAGISRDITQLAEARRQVVEERDTAQRYLNVAGVMILVLDVEGRVILINRHGCTVLGFDSPEELLGQLWIDICVPERLREQAWKQFRRILAGKPGTEYFRSTIATRVGEERMIAWYHTVLKDEAGQPTGSLSSGGDITARQKAQDALRFSEERFRSIFNAVSDGIFIIDYVLDCFAEINGPGAKMFGYRPEEMTGGNARLISSGVAPYTPHEAAAWVRKAVESGEPQRFDWHCRHRDGSLFWAEMSLSYGVIGGREVVVLIFHDVTRQRAIQAQLHQVVKMEAIGQLTGGVAHDFNNLLGIIIGNLDLARPLQAPDGDALELLDESLEAALRGADLTQRLLAFARQQPLIPQRVALNELVTSTVKLLARTLGEQVGISLDLATDIWPVNVDPAQLQSCIVNLATNARDAMPRGGKLMIATANRQLDSDYAAARAELRPGDYVMLEVSDTGTGMTPEIIARIFDPFYTTKERGKGTGLGLSMVFGFIKQSSGHINVYSEPGAGTTFRLYLPRASGRAADQPAPAEIAPLRKTGETVLAVEDDAALRRIVVRQLGDLGYRVLEADSAASALAMLETTKADLVFTDIVMPGEMNGIALARCVHERWPDIKVVLTSGFPDARIGGELEGSTASARLLSKPYRKEDLARTLRDAFDRGP